MLRKASVTIVSPPTISSSSASTFPPAAEAQGPVPLQLGAGRTKKPPHCWPSPSREQGSAQLQIWAGSSCQVPLPPPASQAEGTGPCAVHAHQFLPPSYCPPLLKQLPLSSTPQPFLHGLPGLTSHCSSPAPSPPSLSKQVPARESQHPSQPGSRERTCPEPTLQAQDCGWQGLHAAAAKSVLVSVLGAGKSM